VARAASVRSPSPSPPPGRPTTTTPPRAWAPPTTLESPLRPLTRSTSLPRPDGPPTPQGGSDGRGAGGRQGPGVPDQEGRALAAVRLAGGRGWLLLVLQPQEQRRLRRLSDRPCGQHRRDRPPDRLRVRQPRGRGCQGLLRGDHE